MGWGNTLRRRMRVFAVALVIYLDYKTVQKRVQWVSRVKKNSIWEKTHQRNAKRVLNLMIELEGLWVKLGQYLSTRADVLPEAYISLLKKLQDSLPPRPLKEVCRTIERELGKSMRDLFSNFVHVPLATASIAQVHRATTKDGREVVVKVQHEDIKEIILEDLKNAKSIVDWIAWAEPQYNFSPIIDEWCKEAPKELDFNHEAENTRTVSKNLQPKNEGDGLSNSVDVIIPEVIQSSERVLVLQYMDGIRLNDNESLEAYGVDKQRLVEEITRAYAHQIYVDGFFNGDPHPGNFLVSKEPPHRPILLDFGLTKSISSSMKRALAKMFLACAEGDHVALLSAFEEMGLKLRLDMPQQAMDITAVFFRTATPANEALVKNLITCRPEDEVPIRNVTIRKIPRVYEDLPLYDILNEFQKGHSHMAVVIKRTKEIGASSDKSKSNAIDNGMNQYKKNVPADGTPGDGSHVALADHLGVTLNASPLYSSVSGIQSPLKRSNKEKQYVRTQPKKSERGRHDNILDVNSDSFPSYSLDEEVIGIITMENVIEELLQEAILDETDEYVDVHNKIKINMQPPRRRSSSRSPEPSSVSQFPRRNPTESPLSPYHQSSILHSPASPYAQAPGPTQTILSSPGKSFPSSPTNHIVIGSSSPTSHRVSRKLYEKLQKKGESNV